MLPVTQTKNSPHSTKNKSAMEEQVRVTGFVSVYTQNKSVTFMNLFRIKLIVVNLFFHSYHNLVCNEV